MARDEERIARIRDTVRDSGLDALICTLPENVLMLSGYWPVVGTAVAVATAEGRVAVLAPEDEAELARDGWADARTYQPGSLSALTAASQAIVEPLAGLLTDLGVAEGRLGREEGSIFEPAPYAAMYTFQATINDVVTSAVGKAPVSGAESISRLRAALTPAEVARVRLACKIAASAFTSVAPTMRPGLREPEVAPAFAAPMEIEGLAAQGVQRAGAFVWCMSGPNSALAGAAYARTGNRELREGDFVLVHCNSQINGYWTDITRTYCLGQPDERKRSMYDAVFTARTAALAAIRPGARAADVDSAARDVLTQRGFGEYFTHGIGHNVGFSAISPDFPPRLHPASPDLLELGMTFNIEPSIYIEGYGGLRHCDVVTLGADGAEVLTPFQADLPDLILDV